MSREMVGVAGFEPTASSSRTKRATKLRHTPCDRSSIATGGRAAKTSGAAAVQDPSQRPSPDTPAERWGSYRTVGVYRLPSVRSPPFGGDAGRRPGDATLGACPGADLRSASRTCGGEPREAPEECSERACGEAYHEGARKARPVGACGTVRGQSRGRRCRTETSGLVAMRRGTKGEVPSPAETCSWVLVLPVYQVCSPLA